MSAIVGVFERDALLRSDISLSAPLENLTKYGRDGSSEWISPPVAFGHQHTRLFLTDSQTNSPLYEAESGIAVTADARLDNRSELGGALNISETELKRISDGRLILLAWQKWGRICPTHLVGDYAFAVWDSRQRVLFCARDHVGARPFYYSLTSKRLIFASDISGVKAFPGVSDQLDEEYIKAFLDSEIYCKNRTYFSAVRILPPGHTLTVSQDSDELERFWFPENVKKIRFADDDDYVEAAREIYIRAINDRTNTTETIGVHLSGGLDSSSIAVLAARERKRQNLSPPLIYSWQPPPTEDSKLLLEHSLIDAVCRQENFIPQYCPANSETYFALLKKDPAFEPVSQPLLIETNIQRRAAADNVRLMLSGWGGDESLSFNGRGYYNDLFLRGRWRRLFQEMLRFDSPAKVFAGQILSLIFRDSDRIIKKIKNRSLKYESSSDSFLHARFKRSVGLRNFLFREINPRSILLNLWKEGFHAERMDSWTAHGANSGITYVYPLLDRRLMEFVIGLPPEQFVRGKWYRWLMRKVTEEILPAEVCWNLNKSEPVLFEQLKPEMIKAFRAAHRQIIKADKSFARAEYLDMPELLEYLQLETSEPQNELTQIQHRFGHAVRALQLLDF